ncbi:hypothetical protein NE237_006630 [Protea cynaroides]|uniref:Pentatricopeptide repeat-containing protein n=1 Tax=Protea cynaroides TaxID=273540 RepID=A0A9Q0KNF6_9MAGN|nr:hypothetical protein NE237_006630 [Protea cynaroides]
MSEKYCVVWNLTISAYSRNRWPGEALKLLNQMRTQGIRADLFTAIALISSIADLKSLKWGKQIHVHVIRNGLDYQVFVNNSLIEMYGKCGSVESAWKIFDLVLNKSVISWSSMIKAYVNHGPYDYALSRFIKMRIEGVKVDSITVINVLPTCVNAGALEALQYLHGLADIPFYPLRFSRPADPAEPSRHLLLCAAAAALSSVSFSFILLPPCRNNKIPILSVSLGVSVRRDSTLITPNKFTRITKPILQHFLGIINVESSHTNDIWVQYTTLFNAVDVIECHSLSITMALYKMYCI